MGTPSDVDWLPDVQLSWDELDRFRALFGDLDHRRIQGYKRATHVVMSHRIDISARATDLSWWIDADDLVDLV